MLALVPAAQARSQPALYFLKDAEVSPGHRVPVGDGELSSLPPPPLPDPAHPENTTLQPSTRVIYPYLDAVAPAQFVANASANTGRIAGVVAAYLFLPKTAAMQSGTLNVSLVVLPKDPAVPPALGGGGQVIAWARVPLDYKNESLPNATSFVDPSNATNDPQGTVNYTAGQLLVYGITTVYSSAALVFLDDAVKDYVIDVTVPTDARIGLRMVLENGSAVAPLPGVPVPVGAGQDIVYDFGLAFSLVVVPWYAPDPPAPPASTTTSRAPTSSTGPASSGTSTSTTNASPALPVFYGTLVLVAVAMARRKSK